MPKYLVSVSYSAEGAKGVQLVEAALQSWTERRWVDVPALAI